MKKLVLSDLQNIYEYEKNRDVTRKEVIAYKRVRRFQLGPDIVVTFENRTTMTFQVHEMMRAERMVHDEQIQEELDIYNSLLPNGSDLSATLFIEITAEHEIREKLHQFLGLTNGESVFVRFGDHSVPAQFEEGREEEDKISSVHYIRFPFTDAQRAAFKDLNLAASLDISYRDYTYSIPMSPETRASLIADLS
jgi:hypothetical protein